jgi:Domain of unknown function (DUF5655)
MTTESPYAVHPAVAYVQAMLANLKKESGHSLEEWIALAKKKGPKDEKHLRLWLKDQGLGTNKAMMVAIRALDSDGHAFAEDTPVGYLKAADRYVEAMFSGKKAALRPLYEALLKLGLSLGKDMKACPCKTIVPLFREHVIAEIKPFASRIDFGLALKDTLASGRLLDTGGFAKKDRITHKIEVRSLSDIDSELGKWLKKAYEMDAK